MPDDDEEPTGTHGVTNEAASDSYVRELEESDQHVWSVFRGLASIAGAVAVSVAVGLGVFYEVLFSNLGIRPNEVGIGQDVLLRKAAGISILPVAVGCAGYTYFIKRPGVHSRHQSVPVLCGASLAALVALWVLVFAFSPRDFGLVRILTQPMALGATLLGLPAIWSSLRRGAAYVPFVFILSILMLAFYTSASRLPTELQTSSALRARRVSMYPLIDLFRTDIVEVTAIGADANIALYSNQPNDQAGGLPMPDSSQSGGYCMLLVGSSDGMAVLLANSRSNGTVNAVYRLPQESYVIRLTVLGSIGSDESCEWGQFVPRLLSPPR